MTRFSSLSLHKYWDWHSSYVVIIIILKLHFIYDHVPLFVLVLLLHLLLFCTGSVCQWPILIIFSHTGLWLHALFYDISLFFVLTFLFIFCLFLVFLVPSPKLTQMLFSADSQFTGSWVKWIVLRLSEGTQGRIRDHSVEWHCEHELHPPAYHLWPCLSACFLIWKLKLEMYLPHRAIV